MEIWREISEQLAGNSPVVLVTVVAGSGSVPRGPGAKMLILPDGRRMGTVGGGAVEYRAQELAKELFRSEKSLYKRFCLNADAADLGMICGGELTLFFQYIPANEDSQKQFRELAQEKNQRLKKWIGLRFDGEVWQMSLFSEQDSQPAPKAADFAIPLRACPQFMQRGEGFLYTEPFSGLGIAYIFGGGHLSQALVPLLHAVDFSCVVIEDRAEFAKPELFPQAEQILLADFSDLSFLSVGPEDYLIIVTRGHLNDYEVLSQALRTNAGYIGMVGSKRKISAVFAKLREQGFSQEALASVYTPIGLPILAETPAEIAVSIAAQLIQKRAERRNLP